MNEQQYNLTMPARMENLERDLDAHIKQCAAQFRWMVGTVIALILGSVAFLYNMSGNLTEVRTTLTLMSREQAQQHDERMRYDTSQAAAAGDVRKLIDGLQQQVNEIKVTIGGMSIERQRLGR